MRIDIDVEPSLDFEHAQTVNHRPLSFEVDGSVEISNLLRFAPEAERVDIRFASFTDGRGFSLASLLRDRVKFRGELRAVGHLLPDQKIALQRVGFDAVAPTQPERWAQDVAQFSHVYQPTIDGKVTAFEQRRLRAQRQSVDALNLKFQHSKAMEILAHSVFEAFPNDIAMLSSFGAEAAVGLHLLSQVNRDIPVLFLDTGMHFAQTLQYRDDLIRKLKLTNVKILTPDAAELAAQDKDNNLWQRDVDACCGIRKVAPLARQALTYSALITGRKHMHGGRRASLNAIDVVDEQIRINPLVRWNAKQILEYFEKHQLPAHPLTSQGYQSIGCWPCTKPSEGDLRSGRWSGSAKDECGIHIGLKRSA